ncbi:MAG: 3-phosphoshikimate 1-carboxyvinyltransferase [Flavobacterium sp.]|nr:3-phosphoshikimate 1-carboxyvinyltransferase [Flavobacterium sp.]
MNLSLQLSEAHASSTISIAGSKSETNRLLVLQALYPNIELQNISTSDDSNVMVKALTTINHQPSTTNHFIDIHHAGTAMRFLTACFAIQEGREILLTGSARMKERPIQILVEALQELGADIAYEEAIGFPPLRIKGKKLLHSKVSLQANVSSQYISALLLIAPKLENGLHLTLKGELTSVPYIQMTLDLLNQIGINTKFNQNTIEVFPSTINHQPSTIVVESDWSSASYFYSIIALSKAGTQITLSSFKPNSLQGDSALAEIYTSFGVETTFNSNSITLRKTNLQLTTYNAHLNNTPDLAQTIIVTCVGLGIGCHLTGLLTLKIKETDRLAALQNELTKLGATVTTTEDAIILEPKTAVHSNIQIETYNDHRMAMAFAPLALRVPITIVNAEVVSKSYPNFWNDLKSIGFHINDTL